VRLLLDTHTIIWWFTADPLLSPIAQSAIASTQNDLFVSACVGYELRYKQGLGRLAPLPQSLPRSLQHDGIMELAVTLDHALAAAALPGPHRDPWDRIMMAQAQTENLTVVTVDRVFAAYNVPVLW
jgi:PIN domain nuclease of toxin-antitoxin system